jgi:hypothetical protein
MIIGESTSFDDVSLAVEKLVAGIDSEMPDRTDDRNCGNEMC